MFVYLRRLVDPWQGKEFGGISGLGKERWMEVVSGKIRNMMEKQKKACEIFRTQHETQTGSDVNEGDLEMILRILRVPLVGWG